LTQAGLSLLAVSPFAWRADWAWGLPLIVLTVVTHVLGLALLFQRVVHVSGHIITRRHPKVAFMLVMGATTLAATVLHGFEAAVWAVAYLFFRALPDFRSSLLYSLNAITSYGHTNLVLEGHWQLMGSLEALNGTLLFGLTTAFLFAVIGKVWPLGSTERF
jgi:hypothetical protein